MVVRPLVAVLAFMASSVPATAQLVPADGSERQQFVTHSAAPLFAGEFQAVDSALPDGWQPVLDAIGDRRIVMLGEASHGDGTSFKLKASLIDALHAKGFDVLMFESGYLSLELAREAIAAGMLPSEAVAAAIFPVWARAEQFAPTLDLLDREDRTFDVAGFDFQPSGGDPKIVAKALSELGVRLGDTGEPARRLGGYYAMPPGNPAVIQSLDVEAVTRDMDVTFEALAVLPSEEAAHWRRVVRDAGEMLIFSNAMMTGPTSDKINRRDEIMAKNFTELATSRYLDRKIIVWAATSHILKDRTVINVGSDQGMVPMGALLADGPLADDIYVLAMTAREGEVGSLMRGVFELPQAGEGTLEAAAIDALPQSETVFVNVTTASNDAFVMRGLGHAEWAGKWGQAVDGVLVVKELEPTSYPDTGQ